jgi:hypothetical protein
MKEGFRKTSGGNTDYLRAIDPQIKMTLVYYLYILKAVP